ncbi:MAG TPA: hypothetical protein VJ913_12065 [Actinomycetota bacterium]|nr:hypothetical protein [Actinomycetota bacterium]
MTSGRAGAAGPVWSFALARGALAFVAVAAVGIVAALAASLAGLRVPVGDLFRVGLLYLGPFHHVPVVVEGELDLGAVPLPNSPPSGVTTVEIGIALLSVTAIAVWLLFGSGRTVADRAGGGLADRVLAGTLVAPSYAVPVLLAALLVEIEEPVRLGSFVSGSIRVGLAPWQALLFPFGIAAAAGAAGGLWSWCRDQGADRRARTVEASAIGGLRMFALAVLLSIAGLFVAGVVQPDEVVAVLTPSTARYYRTAFERPGQGAVLMAHHLAVVPNEALWTLVPALSRCDVIRGGPEADVLCYGRFPHGFERVIEPLLAGVPVPPLKPGVEYRRAPAGYFLFLLVPAIAAVLGGRAAARRRGVVGRSAMPIGAASGLVFGALVGAATVLAGVTVSYGSTLVEGSGGSLWIGPEPLGGALLAAMWGVAGGAIGAATVGLRPRRPGTPGAGTPRATR